MTFQKPHDLTYTDMAKWVDAYNPSCSEDTLVEYLYHLSYVNAQQHKFFHDYETYDDFALYCASTLYQRVKNNKDQQIKSIVNYIKTVIHPWYADYVRDFCCGSADFETACFDVHDFADYLIDVVSENDYHVYNFDTIRVSDAIYTYLKHIPRKYNSAEWSNICLSCMLTLQDRIKASIELCSKELINKHPQLFNRVIRGLKTKTPILYHLDESFSTYISVLVNELVHVISMELTTATGSTVSASTCLKNMVIAAANNSEDD